MIDLIPMSHLVSFDAMYTLGALILVIVAID